MTPTEKLNKDQSNREQLAIAAKILTEKRNEAAELIKQVQELKEELSRCKNQFEHLAEVANKITTGNLSHHRTIAPR